MVFLNKQKQIKLKKENKINDKVVRIKNRRKNYIKEKNPKTHKSFLESLREKKLLSVYSYSLNNNNISLEQDIQQNGIIK
uniref:Uncharacterized protein n=1 Tax=Strongyloides papillosus TaxID=174720 RepID=A0A0N5C8T0_STREA